MGSKTFDGVRFSAYSDDRLLPHVHGFYAEVEVVMELVFANRKVRLAQRKNRIIPASAKRSDVNHIKVATAHNRELHKIWEAAQQ